MFEKLLSKFKKDKKDKKAPKAAPAKVSPEEALDAIASEPSNGAVDASESSSTAPPADTASAATNGNGKPRVDVIDAMGNSVADMVTNIHLVFDFAFYLIAGLAWIPAASKVVNWLATHESH